MVPEPVAIAVGGPFVRVENAVAVAVQINNVHETIAVHVGTALFHVQNAVSIAINVQKI